MKRIFIAIAILVVTFLVGTTIGRAYEWKHFIGGGLYGSTGVALKVEADGTLYLTD